MVNRDPRYDLIRSMYEKGKVESFNDIFKYVPKTTVATDLGKRVVRFNEMMEDVRLLTVEEIALIGRFCEMEEEMFELVKREYFIQKEQRINNNNNVSSSGAS
jgi:hypothetical protein